MCRCLSPSVTMFPPLSPYFCICLRLPLSVSIYHNGDVHIAGLSLLPCVRRCSWKVRSVTLLFRPRLNPSQVSAPIAAPLRVPCSTRAFSSLSGDGRVAVHFPTSCSWLFAHVCFAFVATSLIGFHIGVCRLFGFFLHICLYWPRLQVPSLVLSFLSLLVSTRSGHGIYMRKRLFCWVSVR